MVLRQHEICKRVYSNALMALAISANPNKIKYSKFQVKNNKPIDKSQKMSCFEVKTINITFNRK